MKKLFLVLLLCVFEIFGQNNQETFLQANKCYQEKQFEKALNLYTKIKNKGAVIWYNMGNCHYQLGHESDALVCWMRAQKEAPSSLQENIAYNIDVVVNGENQSHESTGFAKIIMRLEHVSTLLLQLVFLLLSFVLFLVIRLSKHSKKYKVASFVLCVMMAPLAGLIGYKFAYSNQELAIAHRETKLFAGPNAKYHVIGSIAQNVQLAVQEKHDNWYKVTHREIVGWINADDVVMI